MLAQNFKTPTDLGISGEQFSALVTTLGALERGELTYADVAPDGLECSVPNAFNMIAWECGTAACIGGWAERLGNAIFQGTRIPDGLDRLFYPGFDCGPGGYDATPAQAAIALRNYLTHGEPRWSEALA